MAESKKSMILRRMAKNKIEKVDIVFCGLVRFPDLFRQSIRELSELRDEGLVGEILLSTWDYEVNKYVGLRKFLESKKIKVLENKEPKVRGFGNIWCQMFSLDEGLKNIKENRFVLKTRPDFHINKDFLRELFKLKKQLLKVKNNLPKGNIFRYKVWIPWYEITKPFYMADECFFGQKDDLKYLVNFDDRYDNKYNMGKGISHVRRYVHPFIKDYPVLRYVLQKKGNDKLIKGELSKMIRGIIKPERFRILRELSLAKRFSKLKERLKDEDFIDCLAAYYYILYSHFFITDSLVKGHIHFREHMGTEDKLDLTSLENNFTKEKVSISHGGMIYGYNQKLLSNIVKGNVKLTPISRKIIDSIQKFSNSGRNKKLHNSTNRRLS